MAASGKGEPIAGERLYRPSEVAALWGISRDTVTRYMNRGRLRWVRVGRLRLIPASALEEFLREHELEVPDSD